MNLITKFLLLFIKEKQAKSIGDVLFLDKPKVVYYKKLFGKLYLRKERARTNE